MFLKLLRQDLKNGARFQIPVLLSILALGLLGGLHLLLVFFLLENGDGGSTAGVWSAVFGVLTGSFGSLGLFLLLAAAVFLVPVFIYVRFYQSVATDEAYWTFTLPVSADVLLLSKLVSALVWLLCSFAAFLLSMLLLFCVMCLPQPALWGEILSGFGDVLAMLQLSFSPDPLAAVFLVLLTLLAPAAEVLWVYFALLLGASLTRKYKLLCSIGMLLLFHTVSGMLVSVLQMVCGVSALFLGGNALAAHPLAQVRLLLGMQFLLAAGGLIAGYFLCRHFLRHYQNPA